jgi:hypothetical protein
MKVNYSTDNENTQMYFSDNFHNIKNFVQVDHFENISKNLLIFSVCRSQKPPLVEKKFQLAKMDVNKCQIIVLKFQINQTTTLFTIRAQTRLPLSQK